MTENDNDDSNHNIDSDYNHKHGNDCIEKLFDFKDILKILLEIEMVIEVQLPSAETSSSYPRRRFQTLLHYFKNYDMFNIDFMVACMQFINIVVHSVEDMNFRVHLQYEFTKIGLDDYLHKLRNTESERLLVQVRGVDVDEISTVKIHETRLINFQPDWPIKNEFELERKDKGQRKKEKLTQDKKERKKKQAYKGQFYKAM